MTNSNQKKTDQLGIPHGTATSKLRKIIIFDLIKKLNLDICFQCGKRIEYLNELSIEHKIPWLDSDNPKELFYSLDNIAFSHLCCNIGAARQTKVLQHPTTSAYRNGCRCDECKNIEKLRRREQRLKGINT